MVRERKRERVLHEKYDHKTFTKLHKSNFVIIPDKLKIMYLRIIPEKGLSLQIKISVLFFKIELI